MTTNDHQTLYIVVADFDQYELVLGVASSPMQTLRIAAQYRMSLRGQGWGFQKTTCDNPLEYLEYYKMGPPSRITFEIEECTLNTLME